MQTERTLCALESLIIGCVLIAALGIQFVLHETPCVLCFLQRFSMIGLATVILLNAKHLPRKRNYGVALFFALFGGSVALRQIALHVCPTFPTFGVPFWGLSLYTWSFIIFVCTIAYNGLMLILFADRKAGEIEEPMHWFGHLSFWVLMLAAFGNILAGFAVCGWWLCPR